MIWYILYPLRGTTEPPRLSPNHPIRKTFQRHGIATAQHWQLSLALSIVVAILFCYPFFSLDNGPTATALHKVPHHAWTSTTEIEGERSADVEMRQVWVHGDYMKALDARVLRQALHVQDVLIADGLAGNTELYPHDDVTQVEDDQGAWRSLRDPCAPRSMHSSFWGFHSPLMYWNCSSSVLESDPNVLATINSRAEQQSFLNFTLRPSSVFAGKSFEKSKLRAADALVITLFDRTDSRFAKAWEQQSMELANEISDQWSVYPKDGKIARSQLYEFRFKPMTINDDILLAMAYLAMASYVTMRFRNFRAVKSSFGLVLAISFKISVSIIASFTICGMLKIDLAHVPREVYPFVVLVFGLENIFRLINEILANPPEMPTPQRLGNALGEVGHLTLARAGQNLIILYLTSRVVVPEIAAFCAFAAVALVFDYVFHLTFFLAVLSVDIQRMELQESLERTDITQPSSKNAKPERQPWINALRQGRLPFTTRIAGSAAVVSFLIALNWHFFDFDSRAFSLRRLLNMAISGQTKSSSTSLRTPSPIHQARTPAQWLRIQDHDTAKELIQFVKPHAYSFVARVYDPLLIVMKGAKGRDNTQKAESFFTVITQLAYRHFFPAALLVVFSIGLVTLLMNYLLWNEFPLITDDGIVEEPLLSVTTLPTSHKLDVIRLTACVHEHLLSIGVDRSMSIWYHDPVRGYIHTNLKHSTVNPPLWPVVASVIDDTGHWLALCTDAGKIAIWSLSDRRFFMFPALELNGQTPATFFFTSNSSRDYQGSSLIMVLPNGALIEIVVQTGQQRREQICASPITSVSRCKHSRERISIVFAARDSTIHHASSEDTGHWRSTALSLRNGRPVKGRSLFPVPSLGLIFVVRGNDVDLIDFELRAVLHSVPTQHIKASSLRVLHSARRTCACGMKAIHSLSLVYTETETQHMIMHTFIMDETPTSLICLHLPTEDEAHSCLGFNRAVHTVHCVEKTGPWEAINVQSVIGIRKYPSVPTPSSTTSSYETNHSPTSNVRSRDAKLTTLFSALDSALTRSSSSTDTDLDSDHWEAWTMSSSGEFYSTPLLTERKDDFEIQQMGLDDQLFVASAGPITRLGKRAVAVGFGNTVKIITLGKERFDAGSDGYQMSATASHKSKSRKGAGRKMQ